MSSCRHVGVHGHPVTYKLTPLTCNNAHLFGHCMCSESDAEAVGALERLADSNVRRWEAELSSSDRQQTVEADAVAEG